MEIFKSLFAGKKESSAGVVGIDIGSSSIKVVELAEKKGVVTLVTYGELQLGPYAQKNIGESVMLTPAQEQAAFADIIREAAVQSRQAVFAMPLASSFVTNVSIEAEADTDISGLVRVEARKVIPTSLSEVTLDWAEVESSEADKQAEKNRRGVLIAAIQNQALERFKTLMSYVGIKQPPTEIECFSAIRALSKPEDINMAIIDIGATSSKLYIAKAGFLMRIHRIRAGGAIATSRIASVLNINFEQAEIKKLSIDKNQTDFSDIKRAHDSSYERAFREFAQVLREYETSNGVTFSDIHVSGGGAMFPGIDALLKETLQKNIVMAHPYSKVSYPAFMQDTITKIGPSFTVALGAALRSFDA